MEFAGANFWAVQYIAMVLPCMISGFCHGVNEICADLGFFAV